ncbi:hypothetical protein, partial [Blastomonas sp. CCH2-A2]|uniref:hypothetical protein n=1 Tax=Blastomonas sp. CCH2-A2 TaxID=1768788 RepID=UPI001E4187B5
MGAPIKTSASSDILHPLVELLDRIAADVEQEEAKIDQVRISLVFDLLNDPGNMSAGEPSEDSLWCRFPLRFDPGFSSRSDPG